MDTFELAHKFMGSLKKGDEFMINDKKYSVKSEGKWKSKDDYWKNDFKTLTLATDNGNIKFYNFGGWGGLPSSKSKFSDAKQNNLIRDIEGVLLVDILNANNPFHTESEIMKMAKNKA